MTIGNIEQLIRAVEHAGVLVFREEHGFHAAGVDMVFPHITLALCHSGSGTARYDMQTINHRKNDLGLIMPGHVMHPLSCTDDYCYTSIAVSQNLFQDLRSHIFSHDYEKFNYAPLCTLDDSQAEQLMAIVDIVDKISNTPESELPHRHAALIAQLSVGYEFLNLFRKNQDHAWNANSRTQIFNRFCDLVITHYRKSKQTLFYARQMRLHPKYLSRVVSSCTHGTSPKDWIEQYVVAQAKRQIETYPDQALKSIAFDLGFSDPTSFYRYFKRVTGITARAYKTKMNDIQQKTPLLA